jgi:hypothetical protein
VEGAWADNPYGEEDLKVIETAIPNPFAGESSGLHWREVEYVRDPGQCLAVEVECWEVDGADNVIRHEHDPRDLADRRFELNMALDNSGPDHR